MAGAVCGGFLLPPPPPLQAVNNRVKVNAPRHRAPEYRFLPRQFPITPPGLRELEKSRNIVDRDEFSCGFTPDSANWIGDDSLFFRTRNDTCWIYAVRKIGTTILLQ